MPELLIAMAVALLIATTTFALWQTASSAIFRETSRRAIIMPAEIATRTLARDLACALAPFSEASNILTLALQPMQGATQTTSMLSLHTAAADMGFNNDNAGYSVIRVSCFVAPSENSKNGYQLVRETSPFFPANGTNSRESVQHVRAFDVFFENSGHWTNTWNASKSEDMPRMAKIRLVIDVQGQEHVMEAITAVHSGLSITPETELN